MRGRALEVVQEVWVESPEFFDLDSLHSEVVQDPGKHAGVWVVEGCYSMRSANAHAESEMPVEGAKYLIQ